MRESALQIPHLTQTESKELANVVFDAQWCMRHGWRRLTRQWGEEDGEESEEDVGGAHGCRGER